MIRDWSVIDRDSETVRLTLRSTSTRRDQRIRSATGDPEISGSQALSLSVTNWDYWQQARKGRGPARGCPDSEVTSEAASEAGYGLATALTQGFQNAGAQAQLRGAGLSDCHLKSHLLEGRPKGPDYKLLLLWEEVLVKVGWPLLTELAHQRIHRSARRSACHPPFGSH
eukprot:13639985-Alexandrium_andersonii.AAC.2